KMCPGNGEAFVTRFNADGSYAWTQTFGGSQLDKAVKVAVYGDTIYVLGNFSGTDAHIGDESNPIKAENGGDFSGFVMALDSATGKPRAGFGSGGVQVFGNWKNAKSVLSAD